MCGNELCTIVFLGYRTVHLLSKDGEVQRGSYLYVHVRIEN